MLLNYLGVELGEEFYIKEDGYTYHFSEDYIIVDDEGDSHPGMILDILRGISEIVKLPWKPDAKELYYLVIRDGTVDYAYCNGTTLT